MLQTRGAQTLGLESTLEKLSGDTEFCVPLAWGGGSNSVSLGGTQEYTFLLCQNRFGGRRCSNSHFENSASGWFLEYASKGHGPAHPRVVWGRRRGYGVREGIQFSWCLQLLERRGT